MWQKKTAVGLEIAVVVGMQNVEPPQVADHAGADAVPHDLQAAADPQDPRAADGFVSRKRRIDIAVSRQHGRANTQRFQPVGYLERLVGGTANVGEKRLNRS